MAIGMRIRNKRLEKGWSQSDLARLVGVARESVSLWETGDTKNLRPENLLRTAKHLGVNVEWLVFGTGVERPYCNAKFNEGLEDIIALYRRIPEDGRQAIWGFLLSLCRLKQENSNFHP